MQNTDFGALFGQLKRLFTPANGEKTDAAAQKPADTSPSAPPSQGDPDRKAAGGVQQNPAGGTAPFSPTEPFTVKAEAFFMSHDKISRRIDERARQAAGEPPKTTILEPKPPAKAPAPANEAKRLQTAAAGLLTAARVQNPDERAATTARQPAAEKTLLSAADKTATAAGKPEYAQSPKPAAAATNRTFRPSMQAAPAPGTAKRAESAPGTAKRAENRTKPRAESAPDYFALPLFPPSFPEDPTAQDDAAPPQSEE